MPRNVGKLVNFFIKNFEICNIAINIDNLSSKNLKTVYKSSRCCQMTIKVSLLLLAGNK